MEMPGYTGDMCVHQHIVPDLDRLQAIDMRGKEATTMVKYVCGCAGSRASLCAWHVFMKYIPTLCQCCTTVVPLPSSQWLSPPSHHHNGCLPPPIITMVVSPLPWLNVSGMRWLGVLRCHTKLKSSHTESSNIMEPWVSWVIWVEPWVPWEPLGRLEVTNY